MDERTIHCTFLLPRISMLVALATPLAAADASRATASTRKCADSATKAEERQRVAALHARRSAHSPRLCAALRTKRGTIASRAALNGKRTVSRIGKEDAGADHSKDDEEDEGEGEEGEEGEEEEEEEEEGDSQDSMRMASGKPEQNDTAQCTANAGVSTTLPPVRRHTPTYNGRQNVPALA